MSRLSLSPTLLILLSLTGCSLHKASEPLEQADATSGTEVRQQAKEEFRVISGRSEDGDVEHDEIASPMPQPEAEPMADYSPRLTVQPRPVPNPSPEPERAGSGHMTASGGASARPKAVSRGARLNAPPPPTEPGYYGTEGLTGERLTGGSNNYTDYGVNDFDIASKDSLSTFAVDVDTASYTMSRRTIDQGYLPSQSAVRVEEFVNYLQYDYAPPTSSDPFAVNFEAVPSPWSSNHVVRVGVQGKTVRMDQRKSVHLTFLVDTSGSMSSDDKLGMVKSTLRMLTEELRDGDTVAIATYAGSTRVVLEPTSANDANTIIGALTSLTSGGGTAMDSGVNLAYQLADSAFISGAVNRVIVCSDGDANIGRNSPAALSSTIKGYAQKGITLTTLGFGTGNYNDTMMEQLANDGDGNYFYIDSMKESRRIFVDRLSSTLEVIAKDVKIQVDWNPEHVRAYRLIGYENRDVADRDFRNDKVDAGEIGAGHQVTALYEVQFEDGIPSVNDIATVRIRNKAPGPDAPAAERSYSLDSTAFRPTFGESSDDLRMAIASASFAEILRGSPHTHELTLGEVADMVRRAQRVEFPEDKELLRLVERAAELKGAPVAIR